MTTMTTMAETPLETTEPQAPILYVIDDDPAVRESLGWRLRREGLAVRLYEDGESFLADYAGGPGCLILDIQLPEMTGLEVQRRQRERFDHALPFVVISAHADVPSAVQAMKAGAIDVIEKPFSTQVLLDLVRVAIDRDVRARRDRLARSELERRHASLSERESEVLGWVVRGATAKEAAARMGISPRTAEKYRSRMMDKMGAESLAALTRYAVELGLLTTLDEPTA